MTPLLSADQLRARVKSLAPLPQAVHDLTTVLRRGDVSSDEIVRIMNRDAALTMTALRLANSPFYGASGRVVTLRDAVQVLGLQTLASAVLTSAVMASFDRRACPDFDFGACWRHALGTALCAQMLAQPRGLDAAEAYTAGLLHDIGRLALATHFPQALNAVTVLAASQDLPADEAERAVLGLDHAQVGAMVAAHWRLAPAVVNAIETHHRVVAGPHQPLLDVLHVADNIVHALDLSGEPDDMVPPLCLGCWERVGAGNAELLTLFARLEARMQASATA